MTGEFSALPVSSIDETRGALQLQGRLFLASSGDCTIALPLDTIVGTEDLGTPRATPTRTWGQISGLPADESRATTRILVRTPVGLRGLAVERVMGVSSLGARTSTPIPTRLHGSHGEVLCFLLMTEDDFQFLLDPRVLALGEVGSELS